MPQVQLAKPVQQARGLLTRVPLGLLPDQLPVPTTDLVERPRATVPETLPHTPPPTKFA